VPLLLCNGIAAHHDVLRPFAEALEPRRTVRFDAPGVGASSVPLLPLSFPALAVVVGKLMTELGYDRFDVLGLSWGSGVAQQLAFQNPRRCRRLVLAATATGVMMVPACPHVIRHMVTPGRHRNPEYARAIAGVIYGGAIRHRPDDAAELLASTDRPPSRRGYLYHLLAGAGWSSLPALPLIRQQTLIIAGRDDPIVPFVNAHIMRCLLPHARLHAVDDGHLALITQAGTLGPVVSSFLQEP
jgi:poly(3-hydroxyalkanoate) depolymerase